jgi:hypothetical protein
LHFRNYEYFNNPFRKYSQLTFLTGVLDTGGKAGKLVRADFAYAGDIFAGVPTPPSQPFSQVSSLRRYFITFFVNTDKNKFSGINNTM